MNGKSKKNRTIKSYFAVILFLGILAGCDTTADSEPDIGSNPRSEEILLQSQSENITKSAETENSETDTKVQSVTGKINNTERLSYGSVEYEYAFLNQPGTPVSISSWIRDCNWTGVAGQVFYDSDEPVENIIVEAGGELAGIPIVELSITGLNLDYGSGGYEIKLSDHTVESSLTVWVQLKDFGGLPLSPKIFIDTHDDCEKNLTILNFIKSEPFPVIVFYYPLFFR